MNVMWGELERCDPEQVGQAVQLKGSKFLIGRAKDCDLQICQKMISGHHCYLQRDPFDGKIQLYDLSTNGTYINKTTKLRFGMSAEIKNGDLINLVLYKKQPSLDVCYKFKLISPDDPEQNPSSWEATETFAEVSKCSPVIKTEAETVVATNITTEQEFISPLIKTEFVVPLRTQLTSQQEQTETTNEQEMHGFLELSRPGLKPDTKPPQIENKTEFQIVTTHVTSDPAIAGPDGTEMNKEQRILTLATAQIKTEPEVLDAAVMDIKTEMNKEQRILTLATAQIKTEPGVLDAAVMDVKKHQEFPVTEPTIDQNMPRIHIKTEPQLEDGMTHIKAETELTEPALKRIKMEPVENVARPSTSDPMGIVTSISNELITSENTELSYNFITTIVTQDSQHLASHLKTDSEPEKHKTESQHIGEATEKVTDPFISDPMDTFKLHINEQKHSFENTLATEEAYSKVTPCDTPSGQHMPPKGKSHDLLEEALLCSLCLEILHDPVSLQPCMHCYCAGCYSNWMDESKVCPQCRFPVERIGRNYVVQNMVDAYLKQHPEKKRSSVDLKRLESQNRITQDMVQLSSIKQKQDWYVHDSYDDDYASQESLSEDDDDYCSEENVGDSQSSQYQFPKTSCRQCPPNKQATASSMLALPSGSQNAAPFRCPPSQRHISCWCCLQPMPDRRDDQTHDSSIAPQQCSQCNRTFCHMYWRCLRQGCFGCLNQFKDIEFGNKCLKGIINGNKIESSILEDYLESHDHTWKNLLEVCLLKLNGGYYKCSVSSVTPTSILCYSCGLKFFKELAYQYRYDIPPTELPDSVRSREDCYWGKNCRTQKHKESHAQRFNHICEQTRFA